MVPLLNLISLIKFLPLELQFHFQCCGLFHFYSYPPMRSCFINNSMFLRGWGEIFKFIWISNEWSVMLDVFSLDVVWFWFFFFFRYSRWIFLYLIFFKKNIYSILTLGNSQFLLTCSNLEHSYQPFVLVFTLHPYSYFHPFSFYKSIFLFICLVWRSTLWTFSLSLG